MFKLFKPYPNLITLFSEKKDGPMKITDDQRNFTNRSIFLKNNNINPGNLYVGRLKHTSNIEIVSSKSEKMFHNCDGLITNLKDVYLSFTIADCTAIYLFDFENDVIGLLHAGWKGLHDNIIKKAINLMQKNFNSKPNNILVGISPLLCEKCYEVKEDFIENFKDYPDAFIYINNKIYFDSKHVLLKKLLELKIPESNIEFINECTYCLKDKYFSYRRDQYGCPPDDIKAMMAVFGIKN
jgi:polyphenol oxidase